MLAGNPGRENMCGGYLGVVGRQRVSSVVAYGRKFLVFLSVNADGTQKGSCCLFAALYAGKDTLSLHTSLLCMG